jgi:hypothetical protein
MTKFTLEVVQCIIAIIYAVRENGLLTLPWNAKRGEVLAKWIGLTEHINSLKLFDFIVNTISRIYCIQYNASTLYKTGIL